MLPLAVLASAVQAAYHFEMLCGTHIAEQDPFSPLPIPAERGEVLSGLRCEEFSPRAPGFQLLPWSAMQKLSLTDGSLLWWDFLISFLARLCFCNRGRGKPELSVTTL